MAAARGTSRHVQDYQIIKPGEHFGGLKTTWSRKRIRPVLRAANLARLTEYLKAHPLGDIEIGEHLKFPEAGVVGEYLPDPKRVKLEASPQRLTFEKKLSPGNNETVAESAQSLAGALQRGFIHEVSHHMLWQSGAMAESESEVRDIINGALRHADAYRTHFSTYAADSWKEYFCETHTAYVFEPEELQKFDPVGYNMVEQVRSKLGVWR